MKPESPWKRLEQFITELRDTTAETTSESSPRTLVPDELFFTQGDLGGLWLSGESSSEYRGCVNAIHDLAGGEHGQTNRSAIEDAVQIAIMKALDPYKQDPEPDFSKESREKLRS